MDGVNRLAGFGYDAAGRMTACGGLTLSWTAAGELGKVQGTGINRSFLYTASGEKVMVRNELLGTAAVSLRDLGGNPVRHYLYSGGSWSWVGDDIFQGRQRIAQVTGSGTRYFHVDHLGSVRRVSTGGGALEKAYDFFPYGLPVKETVGQERLWFGGYELEHQNTSDYTDDLYFLHARWYFPSMGRFLSADPVRGDPAQPQSLNLYAYVRGNPLNAVDPDGRTAQVGTVTYRPDLDKLLKQLTAKTGYLFAVKNGKIVIVGDLLKDGKVLRSEVSGIARALVAEMINSSRTFVVNIVRSDRDIIGGKATRETLSDRLIGRESGITIDAGDLESAEFHNVPEATFDLSMAFLHEAGHVVRGLSDPSPWLGRFTGDLGEVEKLILNPIRQKLGLPKRGDYVSRRDGQRFTVLFEGGYVDYENF
jgi:RHS repeat-associated protein